MEVRDMRSDGKKPGSVPGTTTVAWEWVTEKEPAGPLAGSDSDGDSDAVTANADDYSTAFAFVQSLAAELSRGRVDLPTCPEVASGVRQALDSGDELSNTMVTRVIASDAGLAANVLALVNDRQGAAGRGANAPLRRPIVDLKLAVTRVGPDNVRSAALPYVLEKLDSARSQAHIRDDLATLWERSTMVAAIARVLAVHTRAAPPDVALLAGLLHNVGSVYLLARSEKHLELFRNPAIRDLLLRDWQASIGKAIAQNWGLPDEIADAIGDQDQLDRHEAGARDLTDVLCVAVRAASFFDRPVELEIALSSLPLFRRLGLGREALHAAMNEAAAEIARLRTALGH
jgi:HD-like signal output (HDOD) protein